MNAYFYTLGCKVNQYETQAMAALMRQSGYTTAAYHGGDIGDGVLVVNSCTVTGESDRKLRSLLRRFRRESPHAVLVLTGCMPQAFPEEAEQLTEADIVLGNACRRDLPRYIEHYLTLGHRLVAITPHDREIEPLKIDDFDEHTRAFVKIEDGCNRFCSYCIIPYARGRVRSKPLEALQDELTALAKNGYREIVLVGINLTAYGQDLGLSLADAAELADRIDGLARVRLGSLEPDHMTDDLIARLAACRKLCPQFHLSLQSGCDDTLRRMNRHYDTAAYTAVCDKLRRAFPGCALTTDVMVGFAGETEEEFDASLAFVKATRFAKVHVFPYSRRDGTKAAALPDQVSASQKAARAQRMRVMCDAVRREILEEAIGLPVEMLAETRTEDGGTLGYTRDYLPSRLDEAVPPGETVPAVAYAVEHDMLLVRRIDPV
ncbi:MAG: tRNA (N(6)-L-threonylcarbamoyladenosine(37)-C(2))-methylthiotransferase MtaB [Clostridia bacterium]|nr:tRNA (N(6)-L-threonylcarbamoyladenosine(37)-C(2))-methylthiotransferase MtaB [Clostridia bacterium]